MNLLEFKRFYLKKQNYDYVFIPSSLKEDEFTEFSDGVVTIKEEQEVNAITVRYDDTKVSLCSVIEAMMAGDEFSVLNKNNHWVKASVTEKNTISIENLDWNVTSWMHLSIDAKNEVVVRVSSIGLVYKLVLKSIVPLEGVEINSALKNAIPEITAKTLILYVIDSSGLIGGNQQMEGKLITKDLAQQEISLIQNARGLGKDILEIKAENINPLLLRVWSNSTYNFLTKLNIVNANEIKSKMDDYWLDKSITVINIARKSLVSDYSSWTLGSMAENNMLSLNYIII